MPRYCYLHAGTGKTGSSAIQSAFARAHNDLLKQGYLYPDIARNFERMKKGLPTAGNAIAIDRALRKGDIKTAIEVVSKYSDSSHHLVLSCEGLWSAKHSAAALLTFVAGLQSLGYETKCLVFFRPQVEFAVSSYLQQVKAGKKIKLRRYARRFFDSDYLERGLNWHERAEHLQRVFGDLTVAWHPAIRRSGDDGVIATAYNWLGINSSLKSFTETSNEIINSSPGLEALKVLQIANSEGLGGRIFADEFLRVAEKAGLRGTKVKLHPTDFERIYRATLKSNKMLIENYCPGSVAHDELKLPDADGGSPSIDQDTIDKLADIACAIIVEQGGTKQTYGELKALFIRESAPAVPASVHVNGGHPRRHRARQELTRFKSGMIAIKRFVALFSGRATLPRTPSS